METTKSMIKPKTNEKDTITTKSSNFYLRFKRDAENFNFSLFLPEPKPITTMKDANFKLSSTFVTDALSSINELVQVFVHFIFKKIKNT